MAVYSPITFVDGPAGTNLNKATMDILQGGVIAAERTENKGVANGYPPLDGTTKIPAAFLPTVTGSIPGEMKMWPGAVLPAASYGKWVWADGAAYAAATYPIAAANIDPAWKTSGGLADPGAGQFRVPDLRGVFAAGMDQMPGGARANRITRAVAITLAGRSGEETHVIALAEVPAHSHAVSDSGHSHTVYDPTHTHAGSTVISGGGGGPPGGFDGQHLATVPPAATGIGIYNGFAAVTCGNAGGGVAHENLPPTVFIPYIVRLDG